MQGKDPIKPRLSKARSGSPLADAQAYWTEERRRSARPLPLERPAPADEDPTDDAPAGDSCPHPEK